MGEKSSTEWLDESMFKNEAEGSGRLENYSASDDEVSPVWETYGNKKHCVRDRNNFQNPFRSDEVSPDLNSANIDQMDENTRDYQLETNLSEDYITCLGRFQFKP